MERLEKVIFIIGPTCSGKTELALKIAKKLGNIEIICADSRTIYESMDIGTAKPSDGELEVCPHHFIDIRKPNQRYSVAEFKKSAQKTVDDIVKRGNFPVVVGGSGLYAHSLIYDYSFPAGPANSLRTELEAKDIEELRSKLQYLDIDAYENIDINNKRRLIRAIETAGLSRAKNKKPDNYLLIGLCLDKDHLLQRISMRTEAMLKDGLVEETKELLKKYGNTEALNTVGYKEAVDYINNEQDIEKTKELINLHTKQLTKKQMTWFKRNKDIVWVKNYSEAEEAFNKFMQI